MTAPRGRLVRSGPQRTWRGAPRRPTFLAMNVNRIAPCAVALVLAACGSNDNGGPGAGTTGVTGTVAGVPFSAREAISAVVPPTTCTVSGFSVSVAGLVIGVSDFTGTCSLVQNACSAKASAQGVIVALANVVPAAAGPAQPVGPGTYAVSPISSPSLSTRQAFAKLARTDPGCHPVTSVPAVTGGTVTLTSASGTPAAGDLSLTFSDGSTLAGPFTSTACAAPPVDVCSATIGGFGDGSACTGSPVCQP